MNTQNNSQPMNFKAGDTVVMHTCHESTLPQYRGKLWTCRSDSYVDKAGQEVVFLEGFSGCFCAEYLAPVTTPSPQSKGVEADIGITEGISERLREDIKAQSFELFKVIKQLLKIPSEILVEYAPDAVELQKEYDQSLKTGKSLQECQSDFWNFGYADYGLVTDNPEDPSFDDLDQEVVSSIFRAGWDAAQQQQPSSTWIKVSERLPEFGLKVLVLGEQKGMNPQMGGAYPCISVRQNLKGTMLECRAERHQDENQFQMMSYVTHWMPLPANPE